MYDYLLALIYRALTIIVPETPAPLITWQVDMQRMVSRVQARYKTLLIRYVRALSSFQTDLVDDGSQRW